MSFLLIGGTNDGARMEVPKDLNILQKCCKGYDFSHETYVRHRIRGDEEEFELFAINNMTNDQILKRLLASYRPA